MNTENDLRKELEELTQLANEGKLTLTLSKRLLIVKSELRTISRAKQARTGW